MYKGFKKEDAQGLDLVYSYAMVDEQPLSHHNAPYPVLLFAHDFLNTLPDDYTAICEELASQGYIVVAAADRQWGNQALFTEEGIHPVQEHLRFLPSPDEQRLWTEDMQCALEYLTQCNANTYDHFYKLFDLNRIGIIGHGTGGSTAYKLCTQDARIKAGISLNALPWATDTQVAESSKPFLFIFAEDTIKDVKSTGVVIPNLKHYGFTDLSALKELPLYQNNKHLLNLETVTGSAQGFQAIELINEQIVTFLSSQLK